MDSKVNEAIKEAKEQEVRKLNLILVNVPESTGENVNKQDKEKVEKLLKKAVPEEEIKVEQIFRIGEKDKTNRARLIKIKVENMEIKKKILINSKCLNEGTGITDPKKKIYINLDYTKK